MNCPDCDVEMIEIAPLVYWCERCDKEIEDPEETNDDDLRCDHCGYLTCNCQPEE